MWRTPLAERQAPQELAHERPKRTPMVWSNVLTSDTSMKIASFNINNVNRRLANLVDWLRASEPDVVCLQELKAADSEFPAKALREAGYDAAWRGERSWNGVAILARSAPIVTRTELPGDLAYLQSRYLEAAVNGVLVASLYAPNGNPRPAPSSTTSSAGWSV